MRRSPAYDTTARFADGSSYLSRWANTRGIHHSWHHVRVGRFLKRPDTYGRAANGESHKRMTTKSPAPVVAIVVSAISMLLLTSCNIATLVTLEWPTVDPLVGDHPVGYWACYKKTDFEILSNSNSGYDEIWACRVQRANSILFRGGAISFHPNGTGYDLIRYGDTRDTANYIEDIDDAPEDSFRIEGSMFVYHRYDDFRWTVEGSQIHVQTQVAGTTTFARVNNNVLKLQSYCNEALVRCYYDKLLVRIGSSEHRKIVEFINCVNANKGRNLFEVEACPLPWTED